MDSKDQGKKNILAKILHMIKKIFAKSPHKISGLEWQQLKINQVMQKNNGSIVM